MVFFVQATLFFSFFSFFLFSFLIPARILFSPTESLCFFIGESLCFYLGELTRVLDDPEGGALLNTKRGGDARLPIPQLV